MSDACFDVKEQLSFVVSARPQRAVCTQNSIGTPRGSSVGSPRSLSPIPSANYQVWGPSFPFLVFKRHSFVGLEHGKPSTPNNFIGIPRGSSAGSPRGLCPHYLDTLKFATPLFVFPYRYCFVHVKVVDTLSRLIWNIRSPRNFQGNVLIQLNICHLFTPLFCSKRVSVMNS